MDILYVRTDTETVMVVRKGYIQLMLRCSQNRVRHVEVTIVSTEHESLPYAGGELYLCAGIPQFAGVHITRPAVNGARLNHVLRVQIENVRAYTYAPVEEVLLVGQLVVPEADRLQAVVRRCVHIEFADSGVAETA